MPRPAQEPLQDKVLRDVWCHGGRLAEVRLQGRGPLPPGHPLPWDALTRGTALQGLAYGERA